MRKHHRFAEPLKGASSKEHVHFAKLAENRSKLASEIETKIVFHSRKNDAHCTQHTSEQSLLCTTGNKIHLDTGFEKTRKLIAI